jgi:uncharacterized protein (DUF1499 family)
MVLSLIAAGVALLGLFVLGMGGPLYRVGISLQTAFAMLRYGAYIGLAGAALGVVAGIAGYWRGSRAATIAAIVAIVLGIAAAGIPWAWQRSAQRVPPIHDISTDLENPPAFEALLPVREGVKANALDRPPLVTQQQREGYPDLEPITLPVPPEQAFDRALAVAQQNGWEIVTADKSKGRIEATDTTRWFGFKDDVVVRLTAWGAGTRVDVRSVSRVGRSDIGTNARRIREFLDSLRG